MKEHARTFHSEVVSVTI